MRVACRCLEKQGATTPNGLGIVAVVQENHPDPWGVSLPLDMPPVGSGSGPSERYKYTGKEELAELGYIDFGARLYDPTAPHFMTVDPLSELSRRHSPFVYASANPINRIDPDGMSDIAAWHGLREGYDYDVVFDENEGGSEGAVADKPKQAKSPSTSRVVPNTPKPGTQMQPKPLPPAPLVLRLLLRLAFYAELAKNMQGDTPQRSPEITCTNSCDDDKEYIYRAMKMMPDGKPEIPTSLDPSQVVSRQLGARTDDISDLLNPNGTLTPGADRGGMSSAYQPIFNEYITKQIISGRFTIFRVETVHLVGRGLFLDYDGARNNPIPNPTAMYKHYHVSVQPNRQETTVNQFQQNLINTRNLWKVYTPGK